MILQLISACPSGFGEYQPELGSGQFTINTTQRFIHRPNIEGKVQYGGYSTVIEFLDTTPGGNEMEGLFVWLNDTPSRISMARKSGQMRSAMAEQASEAQTL